MRSSIPYLLVLLAAGALSGCSAGEAPTDTPTAPDAADAVSETPVAAAEATPDVAEPGESQVAATSQPQVIYYLLSPA